jgi:hypothetical protein
MTTVGAGHPARPPYLLSALLVWLDSALLVERIFVTAGCESP